MIDRRWIALAGSGVAALALLAALPSVAASRGADGKYDKRTSSHFVLFQDVGIDQSSGFHGSRRFEQEVLKVLEESYDRVEALLGLRPERPITVVVHDPAVFEQRFAGRFRFPAAGFYRGEIHIRGDVRVTTSLVRTLQHEVVHAAFHAEAPQVVLPAFVNEGLAEWCEAISVGKYLLSAGEYRFLAALAREGSLLRLADMSMPSFSQLGPNTAQLAYVQSYAFFEHLGRVHGDRAVRDFARELMRIHDVERAARKAFGDSLVELEAVFLDEVRVSAGL